MLIAQVLSEYVRRGDFAIHQTMKVVQDSLFNTSNSLYDLKLPLSNLSDPAASSLSPQVSGLDQLLSFLDGQPSVKFLRLSYLDYTAMPRVRVIPVQHALALLQNDGSLRVGISKGCLGMLQNDKHTCGVTATGEYRLCPILSSIRPGPPKGFASLQCEFLEQDDYEVAICPRSVLRRIVQGAKAASLEFILGFEIEVAFMSREKDSEFKCASKSSGHAWNSGRALQGKAFLPVLEEIHDSLSDCGIQLELFHAESCAGQYEFVLPPLPPLEAVDMLLHAREIIYAVADRHSLRATLYPKPFSNQVGMASYVHISISSPKGEERDVYESFYAGIFGHLGAIIAFTYSNPTSYDRMVDGLCAGGPWVTWGTQNRETALRKIAGSYWEVKVLEGLANPYLAMAAVIAAGTNGIVHRESLTWLDCTNDPAKLGAEERMGLGISEELPKSLWDAAEMLLQDDTLSNILGNKAAERYHAVKLEELNLFKGMTSSGMKQWMIERY